MTAPYRLHVAWIEDRVADLWPKKNTAEIARELAVREDSVANTLARMRGQRDPRLRKSVSR